MPRWVKCLKASPTTSVWSRGELPAEAALDGPAIVYDDTCTLFIDLGWRASIGDQGSIRLHRRQRKRAPADMAEAIARELHKMGKQVNRVHFGEYYDAIAHIF